jgi:hypothetical protein
VKAAATGSVGEGPSPAIVTAKYGAVLPLVQVDAGLPEPRIGPRPRGPRHPPQAPHVLPGSFGPARRNCRRA